MVELGEALGLSLTKSQGWLCFLLLLWDIWGQVAETQGSFTMERRSLCPGIAQILSAHSPILGHNFCDFPLVSDTGGQASPHACPSVALGPPSCFPSSSLDTLPCLLLFCSPVS